MKAFKKIATLVCSSLALVCLALGGAFALKTDVAQAASKGGYFVQGGSVRLVDDNHGAGVKFHVLMTLDEFDDYGSISGDTLTLDEGYTTGTVILPYHLLNGDELVVGYVASNGAKAFCEYTTNLWKKVTIDSVDYAESVIYLYNIPKTDYGTEIAVRGVIFKDGEAVRYTEQENGISMSYVAHAEYNYANTQFTEEQLSKLYDEYLQKDVTIVANGETTTQTVEYLDYASEEIVPARQEDGDEFVGFYTASGKEITFAEVIKNPITVYARYRESIVLSDTTPSFNLADYKRNEADTVTGMTFTTANGKQYNLGANPEDVTQGADYATLTTAYADHGEGAVTATLTTESGESYTLSLPALVVTADITTVDAFSSLLTYNGTNKYAVFSHSYTSNGTVKNAYSIDGYYRLKADVVTTNGCASVNYGDTAGQGRQCGFIGTFDGLGHQVKGGWSNGGGFFGQIGTGGHIKDLVINCSNYTHGGYVGVLAALCYDALIENVTFELKVTGYPGGEPQNARGCITFYETLGTTFNNVTINLNGGSITSLFGGVSFGNYGGNTYNGLYINGTVDYMGSRKQTGSTVLTHYTVQDEIDAGEFIIYNGVTKWNDEELVTLEDTQEFVLNGTTANSRYVLDLEGHDDGYAVQSITFNEISLGTKLNNLDVSALKADIAKHGEGDVVVTLLGNGTKKKVTVPTLFITQEITTKEEFNTIFTMDTAKAMYGYYRLANDIGDDDYAFDAATRGATSNSKDCGFRGTFDGNGYTITGCTDKGGLFGSIGRGATIKNVTIIDRKYTSMGGYEVIARWVNGSNEENVNFTNVTVKYDPKTGANRFFYDENKDSYLIQDYYAWLASGCCYGTTFTNVTIDAPNCKLLRLFGFIPNIGYEQYQTQTYPNTYNGLYINATSLAYMGAFYDGTTYTHTTWQQEIESGANIIFNGEGWKEQTVTLEDTQEFLMSHASFSIDLGEYANANVQSIKLGDIDLGTDVNDLDMSALRTDYANHGEKTIVVTCIDGITKTTINVPVLLVTREISSESELKGVLTFTEENKYYDTTAQAIFGYFRLTSDITCTGRWENVSAVQPNIIPWTATHGFRGVFDGAGHTLSDNTLRDNNVNKHGLFGAIGQGAYITNVTIKYGPYTNARQESVFANYIHGATFEDVTVTVNSTSGYTADSDISEHAYKGLICYNGANGSTFKNVTINVTGSIYSIFGGYNFGEYEKGGNQNVYDNFVINADAAVDNIGIIKVDGVQCGVTIEEEQADPDNYIIYNGIAEWSDATLEKRDLILNGANANHSLDLGKYAWLEVESVTLTAADGTQYDLGADVSALDVSKLNTLENYHDHGDADIVVVTNKNTLTVPVTVVTLEITKASELTSTTSKLDADNNPVVDANGSTVTVANGLFMFNEYNSYFNTDTYTIDGHYTLGASVSFWSTENNSKHTDVVKFDYGDINTGFIGTFDGRGFTVNNTANNAASLRGLFGQLGVGALVKDTNFVVKAYSHSQYSAVFATSAYNATFEDITVSTDTVKGYDGTMVYLTGYLTTNSISGCTFNNVTVDLNGQKIESLFGGRESNGYEEDFSPGGSKFPGQNVYNNLVVNGTVDYIGTGHDLNKKEYHFTIEEEIKSGAGIIYNNKSFSDYLPTTNYLVKKDNDNWYSDYTIVYDITNESVEKNVDFLRDQIQRATGGVVYTSGTNGAFTETVGGLQLRKASDAKWDENARYIVIGNDEMREKAGVAFPVATGSDYTIQWKGNSVFIFSNENDDYISAVLRFLEETIGYKGLSDDYVAYDDVSSIDLKTKLPEQINGTVAFEDRNATQGMHTTKYSVHGVNATMEEAWPVAPDRPASGVDHLKQDYYAKFHNSILWVPKEQAEGDDKTKWFTESNKDGGEYDLCYTARGDSASYGRMVATAANNIYNKLIAAGASTTNNVDVNFSIMDDYSYDMCQCPTCESYYTTNGNGTDTALLLKFLTDVALKIEEKHTGLQFTIYTLAYHCYEGPATVAQLEAVGADFDADNTLNDHLGVIYAPSPSPTDGYIAASAQSIYADVNTQIRDNMKAWDDLTDNIGFWYYNAFYSNYMMPFGSFSSMLTWLEYAARLFKDDNFKWGYVQGKNGVRMTTAFDSFKTYAVQKALIEILEKVDYDDTSVSYDDQIAAYLLELESEFFGFTVNGSDKTFNDKGYYGPAEANEAMYDFYKQMSADYQAMLGTNNALTYNGSTWFTNYFEKMVGKNNERYDYIVITTYYATYNGWLSEGSDSNMYFANWSEDTINGYMNYLETAIAAVNLSTHAAKNVYKQHILLESLFPRFVICNGNHISYWKGGYNHLSKANWTGTLANARSAFKTDCVNLGITNYSEGGALSTVYTKWGIS